MATNQKKRSTTTKKTTRKTTRKPARRSSKKVTIPAYKAIILCLSIIAVCMLLLLITDLKSPSNKTPAAEIAQRFGKTENPDNPAKTAAPKKNTASTESSATRPQNNAQPPAASTEKKETTKPQTNSAPKTAQTEPKKEPAVSNTSVKQTPVTIREPEPKPSASTASKTPAPSSSTASTSAGTTTQPVKTTTASQNTNTAVTPAKQSFNFPAAQNGAQLIFVFDDGGQNLNHLEKFFAIPFPFTVAVLPQLAHSTESAARVRKSGNEVILHQPMQSVNKNVNPGPGAITPDMTEDQIISQLFININQIAPIEGVNNHEGSAITADAEKMAIVMQMCSDNGIYFLDSRTNVETKVPYVAKQLGYQYYERNIFLDNEKSRANILTELNKGLALANKNGTVIMIGHIWSADLLPAILIEAYPELKAKGYTFSVVSKSKALKN